MRIHGGRTDVVNVMAYTLTQFTAHTPHRSYYAAITLTTSVRLPCIHIEPSV